MERATLILLVLIKSVYSISINSSFILIEEDFPLHSPLPVQICPKSVRLIEGDPSGIFSVHPLPNSSCVTLHLNSPLDADIRSSESTTFTSFSLVFAESSKTRVSLDIQVVDINDNAPILIDPPPIVKIPEDSKKGAVITTFTSFDADSGIFGLPRYSILPKQSFVSIRSGSTDGKGRWTAELILEETLRDELPIVLSIQDGDPYNGVSHNTLFNFTLIPHNHNLNRAPEFASIVSKPILIPVDVPIGSTVFTLRKKSDKEQRIYAIEDNINLRVERESGNVVILKRTLREEEKTFRIKVTDPSSKLFTEQNVTVLFEQVPMNTSWTLPPSTVHPFNLQPSYNFSIQEETMSDLPIASLPPGVSLSISSLPPNLPLLVEGGHVRVAKIDRDILSNESLSFTIRVVDQSGLSLGESTVHLTIQDINDNPPIFSQTNYTFGLTKEGADNKTGGVFVGRIFVSDDDATSPFNSLSLYTRDPRLRVDKDGNVFTTKQIRDEDMVVRIFATDGGTPNKTSSTIVQVRLIGEEKINVTRGQKYIEWSGTGDNTKKYSILRMIAPRYEENEVIEWIEINQSNGTLLLLKEVPSTHLFINILIKENRHEVPHYLVLFFPHNDILSFTESEYTVFVSRQSNDSILDLSLVNRVDNATYSLEDFSSPIPFDVDDMGRIYWRSGELPTSNWFNGSIVVRDGEGRRNRSRLNIRFNSTNVHSPQFSSSSFVVFVSIPCGSGKLLPLPSPPAIDLDPNDTLHYSILDANNMFSINSSTGRMSVNKDITQEAVYRFSLVVRDNGGEIPYHEKRMEVEVRARTETDAIRMSTQLQSLSVHSNSPIGHRVTTLEYSGNMKLMSTDRHFRVNERRELIVNEKVDGMANEKVCAHLQSGAQSIPFCVHIIDTKALPVVEYPLEGSSHSIEEGRMIEHILEIKLSPSSPPASFRLINHTHTEWDWLSLSPSGVLSTLRPLDHSKTPTLLVRVALCPLEGDCIPLSFTLHILDINNHCPFFEKKSMQAFINENESQFPLEVLTIPKANDLDSSEINRRNCYSIDSPHFFFHPSNSLHIFTNTSFDYEITPILRFKVITFDCDLKCESTTGHNNSTLEVTLQINNVNDNYPRFNSRVKHLTIVGGSTIPAGTQMTLFTASDADKDQLSYSIKGSIRTEDSVIPPSVAPFFINSSTGQLLSRSHLSSSSYSFTLLVNDTIHQDEMDVHITTISNDQQTEILFEIPFDKFLQKEDRISELLSTGSSFTAVIDKCRQSGNSTVVLLHFMQSNTVATIQKAIENLSRSPSPAVIELKSVYRMRLEEVTSEPHQSTVTRMILIGATLILLIFCLIFLLILFRAKRDLSKHSPSPSHGVPVVKRSPYWGEISAPVINKPACQSLQSTEL